MTAAATTTEFDTFAKGVAALMTSATREVAATSAAFAEASDKLVAGKTLYTTVAARLNDAAAAAAYQQIVAKAEILLAKREARGVTTPHQVVLTITCTDATTDSDHSGRINDLRASQDAARLSAIRDLADLLS